MKTLKVILACFILSVFASTANAVEINLDFQESYVSAAPIDLDFTPAVTKGCGCGCPECICTADNCAGEKCPCKCGDCPCHTPPVPKTEVTFKADVPKVSNINVGAAPLPLYSTKICVTKSVSYAAAPIEKVYSPVKQIYTVPSNYRNRWTWPGMTMRSLQNHLISTHGKTYDIVYASSYAELMAMHDEAHGTPVRRVAKTVPMQATVNNITTQRASGTVYTAPAPVYNYSKPTYSNNYRSSCPGGNCPSPSGYSGRRGWFR